MFYRLEAGAELKEEAIAAPFLAWTGLILAEMGLAFMRTEAALKVYRMSAMRYAFLH